MVMKLLQKSKFFHRYFVLRNLHTYIQIIQKDQKGEKSNSQLFHNTKRKTLSKLNNVTMK